MHIEKNQNISFKAKVKDIGIDKETEHLIRPLLKVLPECGGANVEHSIQSSDFFVSIYSDYNSRSGKNSNRMNSIIDSNPFSKENIGKMIKWAKETPKWVSDIESGVYTIEKIKKPKLKFIYKLASFLINLLH